MIRCNLDGFVDLNGIKIINVNPPSNFKRPRWTGVEWENIPTELDWDGKFQKTAIADIDTMTDAVYRDMIGFRAAEYNRAEEEAKTFVAAGYAGEPPMSVTTWATAKNWTPQQAADNIVETATAWRAAQAAIRAKRLQVKEDIRSSNSIPFMKRKMAEWVAFVKQLRTQLGL